MSTKAITDKPHDPDGDAPRPDAGPLAPVQLVGPSEVRADEPGLPRALGTVGAALVIFGGMALAFHVTGKAVRVGQGVSLIILVLGLAGLLFHAAFDRDVQLRRMYGLFAAAALVVGVILALYPPVGNLFRWAVPMMFLGLLFGLAFLRNEDDAQYREITQYGLGGVGVVLAAVGLFGGSLRGDFLLSYGLVLALLGLLYLVGFIASRGISDNLAYYAAVLLVAAGVAVAVFSVIKALFTTGGTTWFTSFGSALLGVGVLYAASGGGLASETPFAVLTRRELAAYFFSPLAYLSLLGFVFMAWISYLLFVDTISSADPDEGLTEPIIRLYIWGLFPVITTIIVVPMLTMRLLSEEHRTGTLEVLLTAPVQEHVVVFSKFAASLVTFLVMWVPFGLFLLAIPLLGGNAPDYRPLISFGIALAATGSAFLSAGLFFSSLTKSQIASAVLTGAFMMLLTLVLFLPRLFERERASEGWETLLRHMSYLHLWQQALDGVIVIKNLLFWASLTVLFLFLTIKVLESRKWR